MGRGASARAEYNRARERREQFALLSGYSPAVRRLFEQERAGKRERESARPERRFSSR